MNNRKNQFPSISEVSAMVEQLTQSGQDFKDFRETTLWSTFGQVMLSLDMAYKEPRLIWKRLVRKVSNNPDATLRFAAGALSIWLMISEDKKRDEFKTQFMASKNVDWDKDFFLGELSTAVSNLYQLGDRATEDDTKLLEILNEMQESLVDDGSRENIGIWQASVIGLTKNENQTLASWASAMVYVMGRHVDGPSQEDYETA